MDFKIKPAVISAILFILFGFNSYTFAWPAKINVISEDKLNKAHFASDGICQENCTLVEELLYYIEKGKEEIKLCNETRFTMFVGLTKNGKSTLVQFLGNSSNQLLTVCDRGNTCAILDDSGTIGEGIASETFLPNLVMDNETDGLVSSLFDMPGFDDNRPKSVEIANALFFQMVLEHSKSIKIVVVTTENVLSNGDGNSLPNLINSLAKLIKDPKKFEGGISLVVNRAKYTNDDDARLYNYVTHLRKFLDGVESDSIHVDNKENVITILQQFLEIETSDPEDVNAIRIAFMSNAENNGSLREDERFENDYYRLKQVIYDTTQFIPKVPEDFELTISNDALVVLQEAAVVINTKITNQINTICDKVVNYLNAGLLEISPENNTRIPEITECLRNLINTSYPLSDEDFLDPINYITEIVLNAVGFVNINDKEELQILESLGAELSLLYSIHKKVPVRQKEWILIMKNIKSLVSNEYSKNVLDKITENIFTSLTEVTSNLIQLILSDVKSPVNINDKEKVALDFKTKIDQAFQNTTEHLNIPNGNLSLFINFTVEQYTTIYPKLFNSPDVLEGFSKFEPVMKVGEILGPLPWRENYGWNKPVQTLQSSIDIQTDWISFLTSFFKELDSTGVQIHMEYEAHKFRQKNRVTVIGDFKEHWNILSSLPIDAVKPTEQEKFFSYVEQTPLALQDFNKALDFTLLDLLTCPNPTNDSFTFEGNYIALSYVLACLIPLKTIPPKVVVLAHQKFFVDGDFKYNQLQTRESLQLFIMSPNWFVFPNREIQLSGLTGEDPFPEKSPGNNGEKGSKGKPGTPGSNIFGVYKILNQQPIATTSGGIGGFGQEGQDGANGGNGYKQLFHPDKDDWIPEYECSAWSSDGENIQVKLYPNNCNGVGQFCTADNDGKLVIVEGAEGFDGGNGGEGGDGGDGGEPGIAVYLDVSQAVPDEIIGNSGSTGEPGSSGKNGIKGSPGPSNSVLIDDRYHGVFNKRCQILDGNFYSSNFYNNVSNVKISQIKYTVSNRKSNMVTKKIRKDYSFSDFQNYIDQFLKNSEENKNLFNEQILTEFVNSTKKNCLLQSCD